MARRASVRAMAPYRPLQRVQLRPDETRDVYRFVHTARVDDSESLVRDFESDRERGKAQRGRARAIPELHDGMSVFRDLDLARERWRDIAAIARNRGEAVRVGDFVAQVRLTGGQAFSYEDPGDLDGHMTLWGDKVKLASCVVDIVPAEPRDH